MPMFIAFNHQYMNTIKTEARGESSTGDDMHMNLIIAPASPVLCASEVYPFYVSSVRMPRIWRHCSSPCTVNLNNWHLFWFSNTCFSESGHRKYRWLCLHSNFALPHCGPLRVSPVYSIEFISVLTYVDVILHKGFRLEIFYSSTNHFF